MGDESSLVEVTRVDCGPGDLSLGQATALGLLCGVLLALAFALVRAADRCEACILGRDDEGGAA